MKLDRNSGADHGKYVAINMRRLRALKGSDQTAAQEAMATLMRLGVIDQDEIFLIKLKDKYAPAALRAYSFAAEFDDPEYAREVLLLADRAKAHPLRKAPD